MSPDAHDLATRVVHAGLDPDPSFGSVIPAIHQTSTFRQPRVGEFVGDIPWAHLDMAGPMMVAADDGIYAKGATGFGTRLLIDLATNFSPPA